MHKRRMWLKFSLLLLLVSLTCGRSRAQTDPLPSWNDGPAKRAIFAFVSRVTRPGSPEFVAPPDRIAMFDNDGTLYCEQPVYVQSRFGIERLHAEIGRHPEWRKNPSIQAILANNLDGAGQLGQNAMIGLIGLVHAGMTVDQFAA